MLRSANNIKVPISRIFIDPPRIFRRTISTAETAAAAPQAYAGDNKPRKHSECNKRGKSEKDTHRLRLASEIETHAPGVEVQGGPFTVARERRW
jgi:hypothetical protein